MMFADIDDVEAFYEGSISPDMEEYVEAKIAAAESLLVGLVPRLANVNALSPVDVANARTAVCQAVCRVLRNPGGFRSHTTGPFQGVRFESGGDGDLFFKPDELKPLLPRKRRFGSVGTAAPRYIQP